MGLGVYFWVNRLSLATWQRKSDLWRLHSYYLSVTSVRSRCFPSKSTTSSWQASTVDLAYHSQQPGRSDPVRLVRSLKLQTTLLYTELENLFNPRGQEWRLWKASKSDFGLMWPWPLTSWRHKLIVSWFAHQLFQFGSKSVHLFVKYCVHNLVDFTGHMTRSTVS